MERCVIVDYGFLEPQPPFKIMLQPSSASYWRSWQCHFRFFKKRNPVAVRRYRE
jgi:hypothetical protein